MNKTYASSDWHGCWNSAQKVFDYLDDSDTLYFLGDAIDRGPDGLKIFDTLLNRPNTFFIRGNHEQMMSNAIPSCIKDLKELGYFDRPLNSPQDEWFDNGGYKTARHFYDMNISKIKFYKDIIDSMPTELKYHSPLGHTVILEHAGYSPFDVPHRKHDPLWDRNHFYDIWVWNGDRENDKNKINNTYLIHGHTPVQYLKYLYGYNGQEKKKDKKFFEEKYAWITEEKELIKPIIIRYCNGHKFDIDMCTVASGRIALLDLDTFEEIYIDGEIPKGEEI